MKKDGHENVFQKKSIKLKDIPSFPLSTKRYERQTARCSRPRKPRGGIKLYSFFNLCAGFSGWLMPRPNRFTRLKEGCVSRRASLNG